MKSKCSCQEKDSRGEDGGETASPNGSLSLSSFPLKPGSAGHEVAAFQAYLNDKYCAGLPVTGVIDAQTESFMKTRLQRESVSLASFTKWQIHKTAGYVGKFQRK